MVCRRCRVKMKVLPGTYHKQKKWTCPKCGGARMQKSVRVGRLKSSGER